MTTTTKMMTLKIDLVMWTLNAGETFHQVLTQIAKVIPAEVVGHKILIDDHSTDYTREIAKLYGWNVAYNKGSGISDGANTALSQVDSPYFCSFEQDVLLAPNWFREVSQFIDKPRFAAASGCRFTSQPKSVNLMERFSHNTNREKNINPIYGKTLDNTIFKTDIVKEVGGFPNMKSNCGIDIVLAHSLEQKGYKWYVSYNAQSIHIKQSNIWQHLNRIRWYGTAENEIRNKSNLKPLNLKTTALRLPRCIPVGIYIAAKMKYAPIALIYPIETLFRFQTFLKNRRND